MNPALKTNFQPRITTPGLVIHLAGTVSLHTDVSRKQRNRIEIASLAVLARPPHGNLPLLALAVFLTVGLGFLVMKSVRDWRISRDLKRLKLAYHQAEESHDNMRKGLKEMARIVPRLEVSRLALSARGVELLDKLAGSTMALQRTKRIPLKRALLQGTAARQLQEASGLDITFERFQRAVLVALYQQTAARVVMPPVSVRRYCAAFKVLEHDLPEVLWPFMDKVLAWHVKLRVKNTSGIWRDVRGLSFRLGREVVFSRRYLEDAQELLLTVRHPDGRTFTNEFIVEHGFPL